MLFSVILSDSASHWCLYSLLIVDREPQCFSEFSFHGHSLLKIGTLSPNLQIHFLLPYHSDFPVFLRLTLCLRQQDADGPGWLKQVKAYLSNSKVVPSKVLQTRGSRCEDGGLRSNWASCYGARYAGSYAVESTFEHSLVRKMNI